MEALLKEFRDAEEQLKLAEQKIQAIDLSDIKESLTQAIESLRLRFSQNQKTLSGKKIEFLRIILQVALLLPGQCINRPRRNYGRALYYFDSEGNSVGVKFDGAACRNLTPEEFMEKYESAFYTVSDHILLRLREYLDSMPGNQEAELSKLVELKVSFKEVLEAEALAVS